MKKKVVIENQNEWFEFSKYRDDVKAIRFRVFTGARGCGKTVSTHNEIRDMYHDGKIGLYIRNSRNDLATARQYFSFLCESGTAEQINLGGLGASTVVLENKEEVEKKLVAYTLWLGDFETFKSSKRHVDYVVYEEFSSFGNGSAINRIFSLTEIIETISQTVPDFLFYALSNNIFEDDLFDNLLDDNQFIHYQIVKKSVKNGIKNAAIKGYLEGEYLVPDIVINLSNYKCLGYVMIANCKLFIFESDWQIPKYVLSSTGSGRQIKLDTASIDMINQASYKSLKDRNKCEFLVGLVKFAGHKLRA